MPYIQRNEQGLIIAVTDKAQSSTAEQLPYGHPDVQAFLEQGRPGDLQGELARSDTEMSRIIEDLIDVLVKKNIINFTDLPLPAQHKLVGRTKMRRNLSALSNLVSDSADIL